MECPCAADADCNSATGSIKAPELNGKSCDNSNEPAKMSLEGDVQSDKENQYSSKFCEQSLKEASERLSQFSTNKRNAEDELLHDQGLEEAAGDEYGTITFGAFKNGTRKVFQGRFKKGCEVGEGADSVFPCIDLSTGNSNLVAKRINIPKGDLTFPCTLTFKPANEAVDRWNTMSHTNRDRDAIFDCLGEALGGPFNPDAGEYLTVKKPEKSSENSAGFWTVKFKFRYCQTTALLFRYHALSSSEQRALATEHGIDIGNMEEIGETAEDLAAAAEPLKKIFPEVCANVKYRFSEVVGKARQLVVPKQLLPPAETSHPAHVFTQKAAELGIPLTKIWFPSEPGFPQTNGPQSEQAKQLAKIYSEIEVYTSKVTQELPCLVPYVALIETEESLFLVMEKLPKNLPEVCTRCNGELKVVYNLLRRARAGRCAGCPQVSCWYCQRCNSYFCPQHFKREPLGVLGGDLCDFLDFLLRRCSWDTQLQISWRTACPRVFKQIVEAVDALHRRGINHMDIKPDNIWVTLNVATGETRVILLDFGVSVFHRNPRAGWMGYANDPPVKNYGGALPVVSTDMYRLGLTLAHMICHERIWQDDEKDENLPRGRILELIQEKCNDVLEVFASHGQGPPPKVLEVFEQLLCPDPYLRGTTEELLKFPLLNEVA